MTMKLIAFVFYALAVQVCSGFTTPMKGGAVQSLVRHHHGKIFAANMPVDDLIEGCDVPDGTSPSSVFGKPLDEKTKELNRNMVLMLKKYVFGLLYPGDTVESCYARFYALETIARMYVK